MITERAALDPRGSGRERSFGPYERVEPGRHTVGEAVVACGAELAACLEHGTSSAKVQECIARFVSVAIEHDAPPERTLVLFKAMLSQLPEVAPHHPEQRNAVVSELVGLAIHAYFRAARDD